MTTDVGPIVFGEGVFRVRSVAVVRSGDTVLTCAHPATSSEVLPGGRVRSAESAFDACERELFDEIGVPLPVGPLQLMVDHVTESGGRRVHEVLFCFDVDGDGLDLDDARTCEPDDRILRWRTREELADNRFEPSPLVPLLFDRSATVRSVVLRDGEPVT